MGQTLPNNTAKFHTPKHIRELSKTLSSNINKMEVVDYDGFVEMWVRESDFACLDRAREDPYYKDVVEPDEKKFFDLEKSRVIVVGRNAMLQMGKCLMCL